MLTMWSPDSQAVHMSIGGHTKKREAARLTGLEVMYQHLVQHHASQPIPCHHLQVSLFTAALVPEQLEILIRELVGRTSPLRALIAAFRDLSLVSF